jgi:hypothetical protein
MVWTMLQSIRLLIWGFCISCDLWLTRTHRTCLTSTLQLQFEVLFMSKGREDSVDYWSHIARYFLGQSSSGTRDITWHCECSILVKRLKEVSPWQVGMFHLQTISNINTVKSLPWRHWSRVLAQYFEMRTKYSKIQLLRGRQGSWWSSYEDP